MTAAMVLPTDTKQLILFIVLNSNFGPSVAASAKLHMPWGENGICDSRWERKALT